MSGQSGGHRLRLSKLNDQLTCKLCDGYFIDATTIIECLHSFCRSCIVKYLECNKYCPICEVQVHKSKPLLNIRPDHTLQDIVYKLVPGCYQNEMRCRREFYAKHPEACSQNMSPEARGEPTESHIYSPDESLSLSLEYFNPSAKDGNNANSTKDLSLKPLLRRYLRCPAAVTVFHLQKLIRAKYGLTDAHRVDVLYKEEPLYSSDSLMDVMYIYHWRRKVPLHLSYRIFESSPKRIKLSEDNISYKTSLLQAGIDPIDESEDKSCKKEWKEVQLKISESGVMSITDISSPQGKRVAKGIHEEISSQDTLNTENLPNIKKEIRNDEENRVSRLNTAPPVISNTTNAKSSDVATCRDATTNKQDASADASYTNAQLNSPNMLEETKSESTKSRQSGQDNSNRSDNNNVETKASESQSSTESRESSQTAEEKPTNGDAVVEYEGKQIARNNNNNNTIPVDAKLEVRKQNAKYAVESKLVNAGSKIDALSAKLQFQPKLSSTNNALKKIIKDKKTLAQTAKRMETRAAENNVKSSELKSSDVSNAQLRANCGNGNNKSAGTKAAKSSSASATEETTSLSNVSGRSNCVPTSTSASIDANTTPKESVSDKTVHLSSPQNARPEKSPSSVDRKTGSTEQISVESQKTNQLHNAPLQKSHTSQNELTATTQTTTSSTSIEKRPSDIQSLASQSVPVSCSVNQPTTTYPYTVQDLVNNAMLKGSLKNLPSPQSTTPGCNMQEHPVCSVSQFSMQQAQCMNIQQVVTSLKNSYLNQSINSPCVASRQVTGVYSVPPCPDAIPISLMKPTMRKNEVMTKGTNLNEICAKIGASGSKINDICAKIGENSKERNKSEARNKPDIPDLLKIGRKTSPSSSSGSSSNSSNETSKQSSIPNVPVYAPSNSTITTENKSIYSNMKDTLRTTPLVSTSSPTVLTAHATTQRVSNIKKQSPTVTFKTSREAPRCWNPTLPKNNFVAVKTQAKDLQNQPQTSNLVERSKPIQSKPAKIFKVRNVPRYLGNPASGVKPMYGIGNETKEKEQSTTVSKNTSLSMMKIDPKTLSPIVSTVNSPIVSPPPYSPTARSYQNTPFSRDICRNSGSPISPKNSPVNMFSTNPFIPSPTPNTNPRLIYSHFPPPFPDASRFPNPLIRSPIGIPPPSAFHSSLPPSINKLYQRSSYIPQTTGFSQVSQPPTVQRIPPSSYTSPKSPKTTSLTAISPSSFSMSKNETQLPTTTSHENVPLLLSENVSHEDANVFNLSKTGNLSVASSFAKSSVVESVINVQNQNLTLPVASATSVGTNTSKQTPVSSSCATILTSTAKSSTVVSTTPSTTTKSPLVTPSMPMSTSTPATTSTTISTTLSVQTSAQVTQVEKDNVSTGATESTGSGESKDGRDKENEKGKDRELEKDHRENNNGEAKTKATEKRKSQENIESSKQEKKEKPASQVNGEVSDQSSSGTTKEVADPSQNKKDAGDKVTKEQTDSSVTSQSTSEGSMDKSQSEQQSQRASGNEENANETEQKQNKSEAQTGNSET